jgi:hypothetical protein
MQYCDYRIIGMGLMMPYRCCRMTGLGCMIAGRDCMMAGWRRVMAGFGM